MFIYGEGERHMNGNNEYIKGKEALRDRAHHLLESMGEEQIEKLIDYLISILETPYNL